MIETAESGYSDVESVTLHGADFGTTGTFLLERIRLTIADGEHNVTMPVHILKRADNYLHFPPDPETEPSRKQELVMMSGFATEGTEWFRMAATLMHEMPSLSRITILDHPSSAPSVKHSDTHTPFNTDSFTNSGKAISAALDQLIDRGMINAPQIALGLSTGCTVLLEANALNPDRFSRLVLIAPAGLVERPDVLKGAGSGSLPYLKSYFSDIVREWKFKYGSHLKDDAVLPFQNIRAFLKATRDTIRPQDTSPFDETSGRVGLGVVAGNIRQLKMHHLYPQMSRSDKLGHAVFEIAAGLAGRRSSGFWQHFTGMWGDAPQPNPHVPVKTPQYIRDLELIRHNCTELSRSRIRDDQEILVVLGANDQAVPPEGFLSETDVSTLKSLSGDENERAESALDLIVTRVKEKFPFPDRIKVQIASVGSPSGHVQLKAETELYGFLIARFLSGDSC